MRGAGSGAAAEGDVGARSATSDPVADVTCASDSVQGAADARLIAFWSGITFVGDRTAFEDPAACFKRALLALLAGAACVPQGAAWWSIANSCLILMSLPEGNEGFEEKGAGQVEGID